MEFGLKILSENNCNGSSQCLSQISVVLLTCVPPALGFHVLQGREEPLAEAGAAAAVRVNPSSL